MQKTNIIFHLSLRERMSGTPDRRGERPDEKNKNKIIQMNPRNKQKSKKKFHPTRNNILVKGQR